MLVREVQPFWEQWNGLELPSAAECYNRIYETSRKTQLFNELTKMTVVELRHRAEPLGIQVRGLLKAELVMKLVGAIYSP